MYAKVFRQIYDSSIAEDFMVRLVFMDLLVLADSDGVVDMTPEAISRRTNVPLDQIQRAIMALEQPDPRSRTPAENGARLLRLDGHRDWGWIIVNYETFRKIASEEQRKEMTKDRVKRYRSKSVTQCNASLRIGNDSPSPYTYSSSSSSKGGTGGRSGFTKPTIEAVKLNAVKIGLPDSEAERFWHHYESNGWRVGRNPMRSWPAAMINWRKNWQERNYTLPLAPKQPVRNAI